MFNLAYRKYVEPLMEGVFNMSKTNKKKNRAQELYAHVPGYDAHDAQHADHAGAACAARHAHDAPTRASSDNTSNDAACDDFKSNMDKFCEQVMDMQKTSMDNTKDQWNKFFEYMMDMQDTFAESLPDEVPTLPGFPQLPGISPKEFMKQVKEFQKMANDHIVEQADSVVDFSRKGQKKVREVVNKAIDNVKEEKEEPAIRILQMS